MRLSKKVIVILIVVVVIIVVAIAWAVSRGGNTTPEASITTVERGTVTNDIEITGNLVAKKTADFGFETGGLVQTIPVKVGDTVQVGQVLATLDKTTKELDVAKALADRVSDSDASLVALQNAQSALANTKAENAISLEKSRQAVRDAKKELDQAKAVWEQTVRESGDENSISQTKYSLILSAESAYHTTQKNLQALEKTTAKSLDVATSAVKVADTTYTTSYQAGLTTTSLSSSEVNEQLARVHLARTVIYAPWSGVVTATKLEAGQVAGAGTSIITIQTTNDVEVVSFIPETDIVSIMAGMPANITFEAYGPNKTWNATVDRIEPIATELEGVPTYKTYFRLHSVDTTLRPGFSATVTVHADKQQDVLVVPRRAIHIVDGQTIVYVVNENNQPVKQPVTLGLSGSEGLVEIRSGVSPGQRIFTKLPDDAS